MKFHRQELWFETPTRRAFLNITPQVEAAIRASGVHEGLCLVNAMRISASVFINDDESGLHADYERWLEKLVPEKPHSAYDHNRTGKDNADAHLKRQIMGREVVVAITGGELDFGLWEQIFYGEFDGRRKNAASSRSSERNAGPRQPGHWRKRFSSSARSAGSFANSRPRRKRTAAWSARPASNSNCPATAW